MKLCGRLPPVAAALISWSPQSSLAFLPHTGRVKTTKDCSSLVVSSLDSSEIWWGTRQSAYRRCRFGRKSSRSVLSSGIALFSANSNSSNKTLFNGGKETLRSGDSARDLRILGICGGIGSGKSLACGILVSNLACAAHIDADKLSHAVYTPGSSAIKEISKEFGTDVILGNGEIDRKRLGGIVFADSKAMSKLEGIVWPHAKALLEARLQELAREFKQNQSTVDTKFVVVIEAAMLIDAGWDDLCDAVWVIKAPTATTRDRLVSDRSMDRQDASMRIDAQQARRGIGNLQEELDKGAVTAVIENNGSIDDLTKSLAENLSDPSSWKDTIPNQ
eukprot:CAMPEP_0197441516 /NCGR_PEP_ID=MMETSP1175-20131217/7770_1 /TAXON_ID=1003142 /ORGANISM="Triceratium dubium, Strain CCMP147" /LENGTH=332 /DNA_ID=CAMNT_0042971809 /DNA_START=202 /DNA_END=1200 /DNA_ORIENTATION=+